MKELKGYLDESGRVKAWASKKEAKLRILEYLAEKFEPGRNYTEKEVNAVIAGWHTFGDLFLIRRGLIDSRLLLRTRDGSRYWKPEPHKEDSPAENN